MKTIGLLGGMSWESTLLYYKLINQGIQSALGGLHSAKIAMKSVDFYDYEQKLRTNDWDGLSKALVSEANYVQAAGADFLLICTNTMHKAADTVQKKLSIPLLHLADATAERVCSEQIQTVGLLGTAVTMEEAFYADRLKAHDLKVIIPSGADRAIVNNVIFEELCQGKVRENSRKEYLRIMHIMHSQGAEAVILGCTEITMLINAEHTDIPLFDTTTIHAQAAVNEALT